MHSCFCREKKHLNALTNYAFVPRRHFLLVLGTFLYFPRTSWKRCWVLRPAVNGLRSTHKALWTFYTEVSSSVRKIFFGKIKKQITVFRTGGVEILSTTTEYVQPDATCKAENVAFSFMEFPAFFSSSHNSHILYSEK